MTIRVAAVALIKNEADILELFIKHNLHFCDHLYILDHLSTDASPEIVRRLIDRGYPIHLKQIDEVAHNQSKFMTEAVREIARDGTFDYIVPLDADEFLTRPEGDDFKGFLRNALAPNEWASIDWQTFCPTSDDYFAHANPLTALFCARSREPMGLRKTILGREVAENCEIKQGNHRLRRIAIPTARIDLDYTLQHVPVRSAPQILRKILIGNYGFQLKDEKGPQEAYHWRQILARIRGDNYDLPFEAVQDIALNYGRRPEDPDVPTLLPDRMIQTEEVEIEMPKLARINVIASLDSFVDNLIFDITTKREAEAARLRNRMVQQASFQVRRNLRRLVHLAPSWILKAATGPEGRHSG